ncbi:hypothetical protein [Streptacidiphilus albus]|nr:hypothetical protein [Streptacidiphilus albus]
MRSGAVALGLVSTLALALTSCGSEPDRRCVDTTNYRNVADKLCNSEPDGGVGDSDRYEWYQQGGNSSYVNGYHRYYGSGGSRLTTGRGSTGGEDGGGDGGGEGITRGGLGGHSGSGHGG